MVCLFPHLNPTFKSHRISFEAHRNLQIHLLLTILLKSQSLPCQWSLISYKISLFQLILHFQHSLNLFDTQPSPSSPLRSPALPCGKNHFNLERVELWILKYSNSLPNYSLLPSASLYALPSPRSDWLSRDDPFLAVFPFPPSLNLTSHFFYFHWTPSCPSLHGQRCGKP